MANDPLNTLDTPMLHTPGAAPGEPGAANGAATGDSRAQEMLHKVTQGAHHTIDRLAETVAPKLQRLEENVAGATDMIDTRTDQLRETADAWVASLRGTVRDNPLAAVGTAVVLGLLVARLTR